MRRRAFLSLLGAVAASWPFDARSAEGNRPAVGLLVPSTQAAYARFVVGFVQRLHELGWTDGDNVALVYRWTEGVKERYAEIAAEFVRLKVMSTDLVRIVTLTLAARLPTICGTRNYVEAGGLMSYGPDIAGQYRHSADIVDKILRGAKPADIPVEQPTKFLLFVNRTTAKALGLVIPESILLSADEVIE